MKKLFLGIVTTMLLLSIVLPLSVNAATFITKTGTEISAGDVVELEVKTTSKVESMQFDVEFNPDQYEYVLDSAESELNETASNYIASNKVRVSAYGVADINGQQPVADIVTMKFKAKTTASGNSSFKIGAVEIDEHGTTESVDGGEVEVKVNGKVIDNDKLDGYEEYIDDYGNEIKTIGQWGYIPPIRIYDDLVPNQNIVAYALPYSDDVIKVENLKAEFGSQIIVSGADSNGVVGTGDSFKLDNSSTAKNYTILIYGDVNGDGKVTTADALTTAKYEGKGTLTTTEEQALKVVKTGKNKTNAKAQQEFILGNPEGTVKKEGYPLIVDAYPEKVGEANDIDLINALNVNDDELEKAPKHRYKKFSIATVSSNNDVAISNKENLTAEIKLGDKVVGNDIATVEYQKSGVDGAFTMTFYPTVAGDYTITPILVGANVEGGVLNKNQKVQLTVEEDPSISSIKVSDLEVSGNAFVKTGREKTIGLQFVHKYNNGEEGNILVESNQVVIANEIDSTYLADASLVVENGYVTGIKVTAKNQPTSGTPVKISVTDIDGIKETTIMVEIEKARIVGITFNHKELSHTLTKADTLTLYKDTIKANDDTNELVEVEIDENTNEKQLVAIVPIQLRDEYGVNTSIRKGDIVERPTTETEKGKVAIYQTGLEANPTVGIRYYAKTNGTYEYLGENSGILDDTMIDAIGITLPFDLNEEYDDGVTVYDCLIKGFDISYDTLNGRQTAHIPVRVFEGGYEYEPIEEPDQPGPTVINKTELTKYLATLEETDYEADSWEELQAKVTEAEAQTSQSAFDAKVTEVKALTLTPKEVVKTELTDYLATLTETDYEADSWTALQAKVKEAENQTLQSKFDKKVAEVKAVTLTPKNASTQSIPSSGE